MGKHLVGLTYLDFKFRSREHFQTIRSEQPEDGESRAYLRQ